MAMYSFVSPFREATFCGVPSCVFDKLGCAAGEKRLRNTGIQFSGAGCTVGFSQVIATVTIDLLQPFYCY
jgi:hypothetical protein